MSSHDKLQNGATYGGEILHADPRGDGLGLISIAAIICTKCFRVTPGQVSILKENFSEFVEQETVFIQQMSCQSPIQQQQNVCYLLH